MSLERSLDPADPMDLGEDTLYEVRRPLHTQHRLLDPTSTNDRLWREEDNAGGSLWTQFVTNSMRCLIPDASFVSKFNHGASYPVTHIIVSRPLVQGHPSLPVLCVADDSNIIPLLHDALVQHKQAGQYDIPIVGLLCPRSSNRCHVLLAWLSKSSIMSSLQRTSQMYIAVPDNQIPSGPHGIFHLSTSDGARAFLSFIIRCGMRIASAKLLPYAPTDKEPASLVIAGCGVGRPEIVFDFSAIRMWREQLDWRTFGFPLVGMTGPTSDHTYMQTHMSSGVVWKSKPNRLLLRASISLGGGRGGGLTCTRADRDNELEPPPVGIFEWSLHHHVFTVPFVSQGSTYKAYKGHLDVMRDLVDQNLRPRMMADVDPEYFIAAERSTDGLNLPPHIESFEALVTLVHEVVLLCCNNGGDNCWEMLWQEISRCLLVVSRQRATERESCITFSQFGHINLCRCTEYDDRIVQHRAVASSDYFRERCSIPPREVLPYATIHDHLRRYDAMLSDKDRASLWPPHNVEFPLDEREQIEGAARHATSLIFAISADQKWLRAEATPDMPLDLRKRYLKDAMERFKESIDQYPIEDVLDAAVTVPIEDFYHTLETNVSSVQDLQDHILFLKRLQDGFAETRFHLPLLLVKHQEDDRRLRTATRNIQRIDCISAVRFLAAFGINNFPIYGLSIYGSRGSLCRAWYSEVDVCCYIVDQLPAKYHFDIANKNGIMRYIGFLGKMKEHGEELRSRFESVRESVVEKLSTAEGRQSLRWTLHAQVKQYNL